tara:strand:- start:4538 stop:5104 length:567 start_codon:yes stop_codon:yes gene_type:complete
MSIENHVVSITRDPNSIDELINFQATILTVITKDDFNNVKKSIIKNNDKYIRNNIDIISFYTTFEKTITSSASILVCSNKNIHIVKEVAEFIDSIKIVADKEQVIKKINENSKINLFSRLGTNELYRGIGLGTKINQARYNASENKIFSLSTKPGKSSLEKLGFLKIYQSQIDSFENGNLVDLWLMES